MAGKHRATKASRPRRTLASLFGLAGLGAIGLTLGLGGTAVTYAAWNSSAAVPGGTITTGSLDLEVSDASHPTPSHSLDVGPLINTMGPGDVLATAFTVASTGTTPQAVGVASTTASDNGAGAAAETLVSALSAQLIPVTSVSGCVPGLGSAPGAPAANALSGFATAPTLLHLAPKGRSGDSAVVCLVLTLSRTTPGTAQGLTAAFTLALSGTQA